MALLVMFLLNKYLIFDVEIVDFKDSSVHSCSKFLFIIVMQIIVKQKQKPFYLTVSIANVYLMKVILFLEFTLFSKKK